MLDQALDALKTYDWGSDLAPLKPIEEAIVATHGDAAARKELEEKLVAALGWEMSRASKDYLCRKLQTVGTAASVPALAALLSDPKLSHMGRYALERIPDAAAGHALREAIGKVPAEQKIGVIGSLGVRQEAASVPLLAQLLKDGEPQVAIAAASALGAIRSPEAATALAATSPNAAAVAAATDASLACAERLLAHGKKADALAIYKAVNAKATAKHVKLAATRGMLACAGS